jgi:hypothetical protein
VSYVDLATARLAKQHLAAELHHPAVGGIGIKPVEGGYALLVNLLENTVTDVPVPREIDGVDIHVEVTGTGFPQPG